MADVLNHSERRLYKATLVNEAANPAISAAQPSAADGQEAATGGRGFEKARFLQTLAIRPYEIDQLRSRLDSTAETAASQHALLGLAETLAAARQPVAVATAATRLAAASTDSLVKLGHEVTRLRREEARRLKQQSSDNPPNGDAPAPIQGGAAKAARGIRTATPSRVTSAVRAGAAARAAEGARTPSEAMPLLHRSTRDQLQNMHEVIDPESAEAQADEAANATAGFEVQMQVNPVGQLHLERIHMIPVGIEQGALVSSIPLAPMEEVNITHREWSLRQEEYVNLVKDSLENYSEEGVVDKIDIAQASENQFKHATAINVGTSLSASYSSVTLSTSFGMNINDEAERSRKESVAHSNQVTRKASSRMRRDHQVTFKVASSSEIENQAVRLIKNPNPNKTMRVDYYQLMRKWRVDLYRYGLRMTYDIAVPAPGNGLMGKILELQRLEERIATAFSFDMPLDKITPAEWPQFVEPYQVAIDPPPEDSIALTKADRFERTNDGWSSGTIAFDLPNGYEITSGDIKFNVYVTDDNWDDDHRAQLHVDGEPDQGSPVDAGGQYQDQNAYWSGPLTTGSLVGQSGNVVLSYRYYNLDQCDYVLHVEAKPRKATINEWRLKAWAALKQFAEDEYLQSIQSMKDRREKLLQDLDQFDALTLRRMEQEEVMKSVLRWLIGPSFDFVPTSVSGLFAGPDEGLQEIKALNNADWSSVMVYGEFIKYIHQAIEWENVLYFPFSYFWDSKENWGKRIFLNHSDSYHRTFLRSGSARVVLTIRPGYEKSFAAFMDGGFAAAQNQPYPYLTIAQQIEAYARTNYPGIPPANGVEEARPLLSRKQRKTWDGMQTVMNALEDHRNTNGSYPTTAQGLGALGAGLNTKDEWGNELVYACPGASAEYDLVSYGADGAAGGDGENGDIASWAEASLVGRWFEYTPTSALDISIDTNLADLT